MVAKLQRSVLFSSSAQQSCHVLPFTLVVSWVPFRTSGQLPSESQSDVLSNLFTFLVTETTNSYTWVGLCLPVLLLLL
jgi:hypothetical protein